MLQNTPSILWVQCVCVWAYIQCAKTHYFHNINRQDFCFCCWCCWKWHVYTVYTGFFFRPFFLLFSGRRGFSVWVVKIALFCYFCTVCVRRCDHCCSKLALTKCFYFFIIFFIFLINFSSRQTLLVLYDLNCASVLYRNTTSSSKWMNLWGLLSPGRTGQHGGRLPVCWAHPQFSVALTVYRRQRVSLNLWKQPRRSAVIWVTPLKLTLSDWALNLWLNLGLRVAN